MVLFILELLAIAIFFIPKLSYFSILPDEFGYWYNAAKLIGYDWAQVDGLGDYYSYGYSIILTPLMLVFKDPIALYRAALVLNLIMLMLAMMFMAMLDDFNDCLLLYPPMIVYALSTMSETMLLLAFALSLFFLKRNNETKKPVYSVLFMAVLIYAFTIHMRLLPLVLIGFLIITEDKGYKKKLGGLLLTGLAVVMMVLISGYFQNGVIYPNGGAGTGFYGMFSKLSLFFSPRGVLRFFKGIVGEIFYIGAATMGVGYVGIYRLFRNRKDNVNYFILMALIAQMIVSSIFLINEENSESVLYGRYIDFMLPVIIMYRVKDIKERILTKNKVLIASGVMIASAILCGIFLRGFDELDDTFSFAANYFRLAGEQKIGILLIAAAVTAAVLFVFYLSKDSRKLLVALSLLWTIFSFVYMDEFTVKTNAFLSGTEQLSSFLRSDERMLVYIDEDGSYIIQVLQFMLQDKQIQVAKASDYVGIDKDAFVITLKKSNINDVAKEQRSLILETDIFNVWE